MSRTSKIFGAGLVLGAAACAAPVVAGHPVAAPKSDAPKQEPASNEKAPAESATKEQPALKHEQVPKEEPSPTEPAAAKVRITNIGLHIGGGPNDAATKAPFQKAIAAAFGEFEKCHEIAETKEGTFGVDILVPKEGGHATVSDPRTAMKGGGFIACVVKGFEGVVFEPNKRGATRFSYSLKFEVER